MMVRLSEEQAVNSAMQFCSSCVRSAFHVARFFYQRQKKVDTQLAQAQAHRGNDPVMSDLCSIYRGGAVEHPEQLGTLPNDVANAYYIYPNAAQIWLGNKTDLSCFWAKRADGSHVTLDKAEIEKITDPTLRDKVYMIMTQARLEGDISLSGTTYSLTERGEKNILQPSFFKSRLEAECRFYGRATAGLGAMNEELKNDRINARLEELGLTDKYKGCDRITINRDKLYIGEDGRNMKFYVPKTARRLTVEIPKADVIELDDATYAAFLRKDWLYNVSGEPTTGREVFTRFDNKNENAAQKISNTVADAEKSVAAENELVGEKVFVLKNNVPQPYTITRVWATPEENHLHLSSERGGMDLLLPESEVGHLIFGSAPEAEAHLQYDRADVEAHSKLIEAQISQSDDVTTIVVPAENIGTDGDFATVRLGKNSYETMLIPVPDIVATDDPSKVGVKLHEGNIYTVKTGKYSYQASAEGAKTLLKAVNAVKDTAKTAVKTISNVNPVAKVATETVLKSVELMQQASKLADSQSVQQSTGIMKLTQKLGG